MKWFILVKYTYQNIYIDKLVLLTSDSYQILGRDTKGLANDYFIETNFLWRETFTVYREFPKNSVKSCHKAQPRVSFKSVLKRKQNTNKRSTSATVIY